MRKRQFRNGAGSRSVNPEVFTDRRLEFRGGIAAALRIDEVDRPAHDDARPVQMVAHFVDLERRIRMVRQRRELRPRRRPQVQPFVGVDVRDRLDVHTIAERERETAEPIARQDVERLAAIEVGDLELPGASHDSLSARGMLNEKVLPCPGVLSTQIRPPCASTMPRAIDSPSPLPRARAPSDDCQYASKMCA